MSIVLDGTTGITTPAINAGNVVGQVSFFAMNTAPTGYLKANGAEISRTTYADLFTAIGTTFGVGDGSTTFDLPDLRGEFARGWDDGRGVDSGRVFGTAQTDALQGHWHSFTGGFNTTSSNAGTSNRINNRNSGGANLNETFRAATLESDGTNGTPRIASETRPLNVALLACIKF
jgi:microcystin-dependent protein